MAKKLNSPLKKKPLREPGQTLNEAFNKLVYLGLYTWIVASIMLVALSLMEWFYWLMNLTLHPAVISVITGAVLLLTVMQYHRVKREARIIRLGQQGELVVGQSLEELRAHGYQVFHDIPGDGHNIDHVLVGPGGLFVIETKTRRKPGGDARVTYDGIHLRVCGQIPDRDPIAQTKAAAQEMKRIIRDGLGLDIQVRPVLVYPGWFIDPVPDGLGIWILNEKALCSWIRNEHRSLEDVRVTQIADVIARYVRSAAD